MLHRALVGVEQRAGDHLFGLSSVLGTIRLGWAACRGPFVWVDQRDGEHSFGLSSVPETIRLGWSAC